MIALYAQERAEYEFADPSNEQHIRSDAIKRRNVAYEAQAQIMAHLDPSNKRRLHQALSVQLDTAFLFDQGVSRQGVFFQTMLK